MTGQCLWSEWEILEANLQIHHFLLAKISGTQQDLPQPRPSPAMLAKDISLADMGCHGASMASSSRIYNLYKDLPNLQNNHNPNEFYIATHCCNIPKNMMWILVGLWKKNSGFTHYCRQWPAPRKDPTLPKFNQLAPEKLLQRSPKNGGKCESSIFCSPPFLQGKSVGC